MSKLMIRGGYGEHGRSCFLVEMEELSREESGVPGCVCLNQDGSGAEKARMYMVDCGIMDTDPFPYPNVTPEELARVDYLFLTHCHKDHSGAFSYFCEQGFCGTLVTTRMTCLLAGIEYEKTVFLDVTDSDAGKCELEISGDINSGTVRSAGEPDQCESMESEMVDHCRRFGPLTVRYGRTGHCPGGLWFEIAEQNEPPILFSGDYQEDTFVYVCDPIRSSHAKLALLDCAHRETELSAEELRDQLVRVVSEKLQNGQRVILPVPQYGRGLELLMLMKNMFPEKRVRVDLDFSNYAKQMLVEKVWYYEEAYRELDLESLDVLSVFGGQNGSVSYDILLLADTHLKKQKNVDFVHFEIENGAAVLVNGRVKKNGPVGKLLDGGKAEKFLFPHHQSYGDLKHLISNNQFEVVLPFHNREKEVFV